MVESCHITNVFTKIRLTIIGILLVAACAEDTATTVSEDTKSPFDAAGFVGNTFDAEGIDGHVAEDKAGPTITLVLPKVGDIVSETTTVHVLAEDPSGVALIKVAVNSDPLEDSHPDPNVFLGQWKTTIYSNGEHKLLMLARDEVGNETWQSVPIEVDNDVGSLVAGYVNVGTPVRQATVKIHELSSKGIGKLLGQTKTDENGKFSLATGFDADSGWGLITVTGPAWYDHPETGEVLQMVADNRLTSVVKVVPGYFVETQVNVWTTIATRLMEGLSGQGASFSNQWPIAIQWLSEHLQRPDTFELDVTTPLDPRLVPPDSPLTPGVIVGLTQLALWRIAEEQESDLFDAAKKLAADLATDANFDGDGRYEDQNDVSVLLWNSGLPLNTEVTRYQLAEAVADWVSDYEADTEDWPDALRYEALNKPMGLLDTLAYDTGPLYPPGDKAPPHYFDNDAPLVMFVDPTPPEGTWYGLEDTVTLVAVAVDKSALSEFSLSFIPQQTLLDTWKVVWDGKTLSAELPVAQLPAGKWTAVATAIDKSKWALKGSASRSFQLDKTPPKIVQVGPAADPPLAMAVVDFQVMAEDNESGLAKVTVDPQDCTDCFPKSLTYDEASGIWQGKMDLWKEGPQNYVVIAEDKAGNLTAQSHTLVRDTIPPVLTALESKYVPAENLKLQDGTTAQSVEWSSQMLETDLVEVCGLDDNVSVHMCLKPLSIFVHEAKCTTTSPKLIFDIQDAHLVGLMGHFDYGHLATDEFNSKTSGTLTPTAKGVLMVPLCSDTLGKPFETPGAVHQIKIWATDSAGNKSKTVTVQFTVTWETPPLWVGPSKAPLDQWDLASYSFDEFTIHKPFAVHETGGTSQNTYRVLSYDIINPHPVPIEANVDHLGTVVAELGMRRGYLYIENFTTPKFCNVDLCSYLVGEYPGENKLTKGGCINQVKFETLLWETLSMNSEVRIVGINSASEFVKEGTTLWIPPHTAANLSWRLWTSETCLIPPPHTFQVGGDAQKTIQFYPTTGESCKNYGKAAQGNTTVPYELTNYAGIASCAAALVGETIHGANFFVPLVQMSIRTRLHAEKLNMPYVLGLSYHADLGNTKALMVPGTTDSLWSDTFHPPPTLGGSPYYNL